MHPKTVFIARLGFSLLTAAPTLAASTRDAIDIALQDSNRPPAQIAQDALRKPGDLLSFSRVKPGDVVGDFMPGNGYFTRLLSSLVGIQGRIYAFIPSEQAANCDPSEIAGTRVLEDNRDYSNVRVSTSHVTSYAPPEKLDQLWIVLDYHDLHDAFMGSPNVAAIDRHFFAALKPGGRLLIVDHAAAPGSGFRDTDTLHRIDPQSLKREIEAAGFVFIGESNILRNAADDHSRSVFDPTLRGRTDQVVMLFRRP